METVWCTGCTTLLLKSIVPHYKDLRAGDVPWRHDVEFVFLDSDGNLEGKKYISFEISVIFFNLKL